MRANPKTAASIDVAVHAHGGRYTPQTFRDELAQTIWLTRSAGDDYWSHMIAPHVAPDAESEHIADAVLDLLREWGVETP